MVEIQNSNGAWQAITELKNCIGHKAKLRYLAPHLRPEGDLHNHIQNTPKTDFIKAIVYCLDPYRRFHMIAPTKWKGKGTFIFKESTWEFLDRLVSRDLSGDIAKATIESYIKMLTYESGELLKFIINKTPHLGVGSTLINKAFPGTIPEHRIMLAHKFNIAKVEFPCYVSKKIDGVRAIYKDGEFFSRGGFVYEGLFFLKNQMQRFGMHGKILDGELAIPGVPFQESSGLIRSKLEAPKVIFYIFDDITRDLTFEHRLSRLYEHNLKTRESDNIEVIRHRKVYDHEEINLHYNRALDLGYEGLVVKTLDHLYKNRRSYDWMKLKNISSEDLEVISLEEGTGKNKGLLGAVVCKYKDRTVNVGTGFTDVEREIFFKEPELIVGHIIEVLYHEQTETGSLRHPRYLRLRDDK